MGVIRDAERARQAQQRDPRQRQHYISPRDARPVRPADDGLVRMRPEVDSTTALARLMAEVESAPRPQPHTTARLDGSQILDLIRGYLTRHVALPGESAADALACYVLMEHCRGSDGRPVFRYAPRLMVRSAQPGSGKSTLLDMIAMLCDTRILAQPTAFSIAHEVGRKHKLAVVDEAGIFFGAGKAQQIAMGLLLAGASRRGGDHTYMAGKTEESTDMFGPVAFAGPNEVKTSTGDALNALLERCIEVEMHKSPLAVRDLDEEAETLAAVIHSICQAWAIQEGTRASRADPEMPVKLVGRDADKWRPLFIVAAIADANHAGAGKGPGDWAPRITAASGVMTGSGASMPAASAALSSAAAAAAIQALNESGLAG